MGFFHKLFGKKKKDIKPIADDVLASEGKTGDDAVSSWDFKYSQSIYRRNLIGVFVYEIETAQLDDGNQHKKLFLGEFIEMSEGRLTLGVRTEIGGGSLFGSHNTLSLSYSSHGESFYVEAKVIKATLTEKETASNHSYEGIDLPDLLDEDKTQGVGVECYSVEIILCAEPIRHRRRHGRVAIEWNVYYTVNENGQDNDAGDNVASNCCVTKTIDISEGGFKGIVERQLDKNTELTCVVEIDNHRKSEGSLVGRVIRCDHMVGSIEMFEMTVQFVAMDDSVRELLASCIEEKHPGTVDAEAKITISSDCLEALMELLPPRNNGADLSYEDLCARLSSEGVTFGVDHEALKSLSEKPHYNLESVIARGIPPTHGDDAVLTYFVEMNPLFKPKEDEGGTVDFKDIGLIQQTSNGDVLVEKTLLTEGVPGTCVTGEVSEAKAGEDKKLPAGENTIVNEAGTALLAGIDGCVSIVDEKINVFNLFVVDGDVQYETGNINHNGVVVVKGDVRKGFAVAATGDILVHGLVESAAITAGGSLVVQGGCVGEENAVEADGDVAVKFINGGTFSIGGNLKTEYLVNSTVRCSGSIDMVGSGVIRNSHVVAQTTIKARCIGSVHAMADKTVVEVGTDPELLSRFVVITKKLEQLIKDKESFETNIRTLTKMKYKNLLSPEKLKTLKKSSILIKQFSEQQEELVEERKALKDQIDKLGYGNIQVRDTAYEGLRINIGSCTMVLRDSVVSAKFYRGEDGVKFMSLI